MDGKGRTHDNIWIEKLWCSVKYEDIYLKCDTTVTELEIGIDNYFDFYNLKRPHENLNYKTPNDMYSKKSTFERSNYCSNIGYKHNIHL